MTYYIYDFNNTKVFNKSFNSYDKAFDFCLTKFKTDEDLNEIIIKEKKCHDLKNLIQK
jgi:hypothetical protein